MNNKRKKIFYISLSLSIILGVSSGFITSKENQENQYTDHSLSARPDLTLKEDLSSADLIIKGTVEKKLGTFKQDAGVETHLGSFEFDVTTYKINVEKVLEGELDSDSITLYQHGSADISTDAVNHVKENEEVYLILTERPDGKGYWSYNFDDGIWKIKGKPGGEIVESNTHSQLLTPFIRESTNDFEKTIIDAVENN